MERWKPIKEFPSYSVSDEGRVRNDSTGHVLSMHANQYGVVCVGLFQDGRQYQRSVPKIVAMAFVPHPRGPLDTPINKNGNRWDNRVENLAWRPRWYAVDYNRQFRHPYPYPIHNEIVEVATGDVFPDSFTCAIHFGLLEKDLVLSILNRTVTAITRQEFQVLE